MTTTVIHLLQTLLDDATDDRRAALLAAIDACDAAARTDAEIIAFVNTLCQGDLAARLAAKSPVAGALKSLQATLRHLAWQAERVAGGDYTQRLDFMGDLSHGFNEMVTQLHQRDAQLAEYTRTLEQEVEARTRLADALRIQEAQYRRLIELAPFPILLFRQTDALVTFANTRAALSFDMPATALLNRPVSDLFAADAATARLLAILQQGDTFSDAEVQFRRQDGTTFWALCSTTAASFAGESATYIAITDITKQKRMEEELRDLGFHDRLTGLYNRHYYDTELQRLRDGRQYPITVFMLDADGLKQVNDTLGHVVGDRFIIEVARLLRRAFRPDDVQARIGGDEFAVVLPLTDATAAQRILVRVRALVDEHRAQMAEFPFSVSIGIATADAGTPLDAAHHAADQAMYAEKSAKKTARGR
jgi:diguanylate cyclase (GGDEF)-like protein/PAS domain S-box-containing protein